MRLSKTRKQIIKDHQGMKLSKEAFKDFLKERRKKNRIKYNIITEQPKREIKRLKTERYMLDIPFDTFDIIDTKPNQNDEIRHIRKYKTIEAAQAFIEQANNKPKKQQKHRQKLPSQYVFKYLSTSKYRPTSIITKAKKK